MILLTAFISLISTIVCEPSNPSSVLTPDKVLVIRIDESAIVTDGFTTISSDELANYIRERLFKTYTSTGRMYDRILLQKNGEPPELAFQVLLKEIKLGQQEALNELCLHKYKRLFENLSGKQQQKIKKVFPVLFQVNYLTQ